MSGCSAHMRRTPYRQEGDVFMHALMVFFWMEWKSRMKLVVMLFYHVLLKQYCIQLVG